MSFLLLSCCIVSLVYYAKRGAMCGKKCEKDDFSEKGLPTECSGSGPTTHLPDRPLATPLLPEVHHGFRV